ncbi:hypothetical protein IFM89_003364 [Coptis chinensis]|uniref:BHLH domain-containing protein n=1 Tax=Coptis chinensis TaxID=261450 RepID=A0A835MDZ2_9MAGN|nr:hypothetical protein IFM89_003364 [Coptis chinensis]
MLKLTKIREPRNILVSLQRVMIRVRLQLNLVKMDLKLRMLLRKIISIFEARRGQATNSHSLAERVRREKISERMKFLQELVPGCSKVTGKAVMLDEIINYVQSLQRQVEFLSMKLATVNPRLDFNIEGILAKDNHQQIPSGWDDELHNVVQMSYGANGPFNNQDLNGSLPPGHMKVEL